MKNASPVADTSTRRNPPRVSRRRHKGSGFTLIETVLALGIVAFALIPVMGLLPLGLGASRSAADLTMSAQIAQRLSGLIQQTDPSQYVTLEASCYYFDNEGQPLTGSTRSLYTACIILPTPATTSLADPKGVTTLQILVVNDPTHSLQSPPASATALPNGLQARAVVLPVYIVGASGA